MASEKKVKCFPSKTVGIVDKIEFLLISTTLKGLNTMGFGENPAEAPQEIRSIHDFSTGNLHFKDIDMPALCANP